MKHIRVVTFLILSAVIFISCSTENTPVYQLTTSVNPAEAGSVSPTEGEYDEGTEVTLTATPNEGWLFDHWQGDLSGSENPHTLTMDSDKDITAFFIKKTYPLTVTVEGEGTVQEEVIQEKSTDYEHGTVVELTAEPEVGWEFSGWGESLESTENPTTVTVDEPMKITATFERKLYEVEILTEGKGSVDITIISGQKQEDKYEYGTVIKLLALPAEDWTFLRWELDKQSENNPVQITIDSDKTIRALFTGTDTFYFANNGVTIKCPTAIVGEKGFVDGVEYEAVNRQLLDQQINEMADLTKVCTSLVTDMSYLFSGNESFNQPIGNWDVSNVTTMYQMFTNAEDFNQPIGSWDVGLVTNMLAMFQRARSFNQPIRNWEVRNVTIMTSLFYEADSFNQSIGNWNVGNVTNMDYMFYFAHSFNQSIEDWDVNNVNSMGAIFYGAGSFNQPISNWDVSNVTNMDHMFTYASSFNQPIGSWNVENVTNMLSMFGGADSFNQPIGEWDVRNVIDMIGMFDGAGSFNQPIGNWDVGNVKNMFDMFYNASSFNQDLTSWCVSNIPSEPQNFAKESPLEEKNKPVWGTCPE